MSAHGAAASLTSTDEAAKMGRLQDDSGNYLLVLECLC